MDIATPRPNQVAHPGPNQVIRVGPAREKDKSHGFGGRDSFSEGPPARCYIMSEGHIERVVPIAFDEDGRPSDIAWRPGHAVMIDRLLFTYGTHSFPLQIDPPAIIQAGQKFHLALRHMGLMDRFGRDYLTKVRA